MQVNSLAVNWCRTIARSPPLSPPRTVVSAPGNPGNCVTVCNLHAICRARCRQKNIMVRIFCNTRPKVMSSEFHQLSEKVAQLAALTQSLRRENADLRLNVTALATEKAELSRRMDEAHQRITALLEKLPAAIPASPALNEEETA